MGDIADDHYDQMIDAGCFHVKARPAPRCHRCKEVCYWAQRRGQWVLMDSGKPHVCSPAVMEKQAIEGFKDA